MVELLLEMPGKTFLSPAAVGGWEAVKILILGGVGITFCLLQWVDVGISVYGWMKRKRG